MGKLLPKKPARRKSPSRRSGNAAIKARTPLGAQLRRIREEIVKSGEPLLTLDEVRAEVRRNRGGVVEDDE